MINNETAKIFIDYILRNYSLSAEAKTTLQQSLFVHGLCLDKLRDQNESFAKELRAVFREAALDIIEDVPEIATHESTRKLFLDLASMLERFT